jgi:hypothetical protein
MGRARGRTSSGTVSLGRGRAISSLRAYIAQSALPSHLTPKFYRFDGSAWTAERPCEYVAYISGQLDEIHVDERDAPKLPERLTANYYHLTRKGWRPLESCEEQNDDGSYRWYDCPSDPEAALGDPHQTYVQLDRRDLERFRRRLFDEGFRSVLSPRRLDEPIFNVLPDELTPEYYSQKGGVWRAKQPSDWYIHGVQADVRDAFPPGAAPPALR